MRRMRHFLWPTISTALVAIVGILPVAVAAQEDLEELEEKAMKAAVQRVADSVVAIETIGGLEKVGGLLVGTGPTTGLIVSEDGYIISSAFNFVQKPSSILVTLPDGKRLSANIVGRDHSRMLVLLKVEAEEALPPPVAVPRDEMTVGQWTLAVGRTYDLHRVNMSVGVLSAKNRMTGKAIQTDAKISPNNYGGPLIDIYGRVLGVLVPLSPRGRGEVAGAEWYDSGIGFAIPLEEMGPQIERMKLGEDLFPGVMGVSLKGGDVYASQAEVAACPANSPAADAGIKPGDIIVEVDGVQIERQMQLRREIGRRYAGDELRVVVLRGDQRIETVVELTDKLEPYQHPFLGVLPMRTPGDEKGVTVRYVYPGGPAFEASIQQGDRLVRLDDEEIPDAAGMREMIALREPGDKLKLDIQRGDEAIHIEVTLATLPTDIPSDFPPARGEEQSLAGEPSDNGPPDIGIVEIKIPEEKNECIAYVPPTYRADVAHGVVVWLHAPGGFDQRRLIDRWKDHCQQNDIILLAPKSADPDKWRPTEVAFIRKVMDHVIESYHIDPTRVVVHGHQGGGAMAYLVAFAHLDLVRGVAVTDASLPARARPPANDPMQRIAFYTTCSAESKLAKPVDQGVRRLRELKFPVTVNKRGGKGRYLNAEELSDLIRWIDALDRI